MDRVGGIRGQAFIGAIRLRNALWDVCHRLSYEVLENVSSRGDRRSSNAAGLSKIRCRRHRLIRPAKYAHGEPKAQTGAYRFDSDYRMSDPNGTPYLPMFPRWMGVPRASGDFPDVVRMTRQERGWEYTRFYPRQ
jgi:hypothetical protein